MFAINPFWRGETQGSYALLFNAMLNWDHLDLGKPLPPAGPQPAQQPTVTPSDATKEAADRAVMAAKDAANRAKEAAKK